MKRNQFTFYASFYDAISRIRNKSARLLIYDALCQYALMGEEPDLEAMPEQVSIVFSLIRPTLLVSLRKAKYRAKIAEDNGQDNGRDNFCNKKENEVEGEKERENEREVENECLNTHSECAEPFEIFWSAYPKKVDKSGAKRAFKGVEVPVQQLVSALQEQQRSSQWNADGGRYIPNAATWLSRKGWEDKLPVAGEKVPKGATGLGPEELENIQRLLREG